MSMAETRTLPAVPDEGQPVYLPDAPSLRAYHETAQHAAEYLWDNGTDDPPTVLAHPCRIVTLPVPDLVDYVSEVWGDEAYEDWELDDSASKPLKECIAALERYRPIVWEPLTGKRIVLPTITGRPGAQGR